jgi:hypothetical protein
MQGRKDMKDSRSPSYGECFGTIALGLTPIFLLMGIAAVAGSDTVNWNNQYVHGPSAIPVALLLVLIFSAILGGVQKLGYLIYGLIRRKNAPAG